ncbi:CNBD2-like protein [Mya arenaria]|uniref:CNBD2-like protein n=1 Tax=Mya arenaria TaxID=6604 RepID=A0ABY7DP19_MYAAR|nr:CNBD2-like protein [Mya arenaria]
MGLQVDPSGVQSPLKMSRKMSEVDYIPTLDDQVIRQTSASAVKTSGTTKQWGRVKNVAHILSEAHLDDDEDLSQSERDDILCSPKRFGVDDFHKTAQLLMKSKKLAQKIKTRYNSARTAEKLKSKTAAEWQDLSEFALRPVEKMDKFDLKQVYQKMKRKKQMKIAVLQSQFISDLPEMSKMTVKEHLGRKISALERLKTSKFVVDPCQVPLEKENSCLSQPANSTSSRRQSKLRYSIDLDIAPVLPRLPNYNQGVEPMAQVRLSSIDIDREIAVSRNRERLESELELPIDRLARLTLLRNNVQTINGKFLKLAQGKRKEGGTKTDTEQEEETPYYAPSRFTQNGMAQSFFKKYARIVVIVTQWINMIMSKQNDFEKELKSFVDIANEVEEKAVTTALHDTALTFDKKLFKANTEISLSTEVRKILTTSWQSRTPQMIKQVMNGLQSLRSLSEYPVSTQAKLCKVAWYQTIGAKKLIVRQGHHAESFYFILSGTAFVKKMIQDPVTGEPKAQVAARLTKGHSFGEIGLLFDTLRTATVESATPMELLVIGKEDFVRIFMKAENPDDEPEHIKFLKQIPFISSWPLEVLKLEAGACLTHYFKRGSLVTDNDRHSEWIYFIMSGSCEVLKKLKAVKARNLREIRPKSDIMSDIILPELGTSNPHAKIDSGRRRYQRRTIHPEVFEDMTNYYDSLRKKYKAISNEGQTKPAKPQLKEDTDIELDDMPTQADLQLPKMFTQTASARKFSLTERPARVRFLDEGGNTVFNVGEEEEVEDVFTLVPAVPLNNERPASRAKFDENFPKLQPENFNFMWSPVLNQSADQSRLPSREKLSQQYRPTSRMTSYMAPPNPPEDVFVKVELLQTKECFVSRGAEVIMLSKKVFLKYADQVCRLRLRDMIKVYPPENAMQENMQLEADWSAYKGDVLTNYITHMKSKRDNMEPKPRCKSNMY